MPVSSYIFFCDKLVINIPGCFVVLLTLTSVLPALLNKSAVFGLQNWPFFEKESHFYVVLSEGSVHEISWF